MFFLEKCCRRIRHLPFLRSARILWDMVTPSYESALRMIYGNALKRLINKTDVVYVPQKLRHFTDTYEAGFWKMVMDEVRPGDSIADVGAFLGFYTFAFAKRAARGGRVVAFEPDHLNAAFLKNISRRYKLSIKPEIIGCAVGEKRQRLKFDSQGSFTSDVISSGRLKGESKEVECVSLDEFFGDEKLDIAKIDVEGYEEKVLLGARNILMRKNGYPRAIFIEVHPYAWNNYGTTDEAILSLLRFAGYRVLNMDGEKVSAIKDYGSIIAMKD